MRARTAAVRRAVQVVASNPELSQSILHRAMMALANETPLISVEKFKEEAERLLDVFQPYFMYCLK